MTTGLETRLEFSTYLKDKETKDTQLPAQPKLEATNYFLFCFVFGLITEVYTCMGMKYIIVLSSV